SNWVPLSASIADTEFFSIAYDSHDADPTKHEILGGTQDNGTRSQAGRDSFLWQDISGGDGGRVAVDPSGVRYFFNSQVLYRALPSQIPSQPNGMNNPPYGSKVQYASVAGGAYGSGLNSADQQNWVKNTGGDASFPFAMNPSNLNRILFGIT